MIPCCLCYHFYAQRLPINDGCPCGQTNAGSALLLVLLTALWIVLAILDSDTTHQARREQWFALLLGPFGALLRWRLSVLNAGRVRCLHLLLTWHQREYADMVLDRSTRSAAALVPVRNICCQHHCVHRGLWHPGTLSAICWALYCSCLAISRCQGMPVPAVCPESGNRTGVLAGADDGVGACWFCRLTQHCIHLCG